jgi:hypothetical protein
MAETMHRPTPVLPLVASMRMSPGRVGLIYADLGIITSSKVKIEPTKQSTKKTETRTRLNSATP